MHDTPGHGKSAYEIARARGYRFSEEQWLKSLRGQPGAPGEKGDRGERGPRGFDGAHGRNGVDGKDGRDGIDGKAGTDGRDGALPEPVPWTAKFERGINRLTQTIRIKSAQGERWRADVLRDATGIIDEVQFIPE